MRPEINQANAYFNTDHDLLGWYDCCNLRILLRRVLAAARQYGPRMGALKSQKRNLCHM